MKLYKKPEIIFEDFSLSTNIAAGCVAIANSAQGACYVSLDRVPGLSGIRVFADPLVGCDFHNDVNTEGSDWTIQVGDNTICYNNPSDIFATFNS